MALNPQYIPLYQLQQYFVDKVTGAPLAGGLVYFYSDVNRTIPKTVYELSSTTGTYTYVPLPNPIVLSSVGTPVDNNGNDIVIYAFPFDAVTGESELYYVVVQDSLGRPQFTREAVPGISGSGTPGNDAGIFNYIPNGQFLVHTNLPSITNTLVAGTNVIAQGGFTIELSNPLNSVNTLTYNALGFTEAPPNSPRYEAVFSCTTPSAMDSIKNFRIKWNDVNKFSSNDDFYTFAFWADSLIDIPISIQIVKFFGTNGSVVPPETIFTDTIVPGGEIYQYQFQFGTNEGEIVDTVNNNDYVAIDISFPTNIGFTVSLTNFILANGQIVFTAFPLQTNADMITRGNDGWTDNPKPNGYDLHLPKLQTRIGYQYYEDDVGDIGTTIRPIVSPLSTFPLPTSNRMAFDGAAYIYADYSTIGIPFSRLGTVLIEISPVANTPIFGTGLNYATAYINNASDTDFRLAVNNSGVGINPATDGGIPTGFTFTTIPTYNGSMTGSANIGYFAFNSGVATNQVICKGNFTNTSGNNPAVDGGIPTGFTITSVRSDPFGGNNSDSLYAFQFYYFSVDTLPAAALITGGLGTYFEFWNATTEYFMWFNTGTETVPPGAGLPIEVKVNPTDTAADVANTIKEVMNAVQDTNIHVGTTPPPGSFFIFQTNPGGIRNFHVWYSDQTGGTEPIIGGSTGIHVLINSTDAHSLILTKTLIAINQYQYAVPNAQGLFLRNADPNGVYDFDNLTRWSTVTALTGPNVGTYEYGQFLSHWHEYPVGSAAGAVISSQGTTTSTNPDTTHSGGTETRPVNMYVNYYIKY